MYKTITQMPGKFPMGLFGEYRKDPLDTFLKASEMGDIVRMDFGLGYVGYLLNRPEYIKHVLQDRNTIYRREKFFSKQIETMSGECLLTSLGGDSWLKRRRLMQPAFHNKRIESFGEIISDSALNMLESWKQSASLGEAIDIQEELSHTILKLVAKVLFGIDLSGEVNELSDALEKAMDYVAYRFDNPWAFPEWVPTTRNIKFLLNMRTVDKFMYKFIKERRQQKDLGTKSKTIPDLLDIMMEAEIEETGEKLNDKQLRNELCATFVAGHDTTVGSLVWALYLIATHPSVEQKLCQEYSEVLKDRIPNIMDLPSLKYTEMVVKEAMRLYPAAWILSRESLEDDIIDDYFIASGSLIFACPYSMHRQREFWDEPEKFLPERFKPEEEEKRHSFTYFPFGGGPRMCIGKPLAMAELQLFVATILQQVSLKPLEGHPVIMKPNIGLYAKYGVKMNIETR